MLKTGVVPGLNKVDPEKLLSKGLVFACLSGLPTACHLIASRQPTAAASLPTEVAMPGCHEMRHKHLQAR